MKKIRLATVTDAQEMLEIYKYYVLKTPITFELTIPPLEEFAQRILDRQDKFPWLVYEIDQEIVGYAYASAFRDRKAYDWSVEATVYLKDGFKGQGIGKRLYQELFIILKDQGAINIIGGITLPNEASVGLHECLGFTQMANIKDAGYKLGRWWDVGYWQLQFSKPEVVAPLKKPKIKEVIL